MNIPLEIILAFKPKPHIATTEIAQEQPCKKKTSCSPVYSRDRISTYVSKPTRKSKGRFVTVMYRKTSLEFQEKVRQSKFDVFNNLF